MNTALVVFVAVPAVAALALAILFNSLVRVRNHCIEAWANVETELQRRYDLIPNLVSTVKGYASYERELLEEVTRLRALCAGNHGSPKEQEATENQLVGALGRLLARVEAYPDLKANQNFLHLQQELVNTEDRIQAARRFYNGNVRENNNKVQMFPTNLLAQWFGFAERQYFEVDGLRARQAPVAAFQPGAVPLETRENGV